MRRALASAAVLAFVTAASAAAALPRAGTLVAGSSLAGVRLGEPAAQVRAALGGSYGVCNSCARPTWYFTYRAFAQPGLGVELTGDRVSAVYTLWQPHGWHGPKGLVLGATEEAVNARLGPLLPIACSGYAALVHDQAKTRTAYYVLNGKLWGFGLLRAQANPCR